MKEYVIILLLSLTGVEEIKLNSKGLQCGDLANAWREVITTYRDGKNQGTFTSDGKVLIGHICK